MPTIKVAYLSTAIDVGGADRVSQNFLANIDRNRFEIVPILLVRPWEPDNNVVVELTGKGFRVHRVPVATNPVRDRLRIARCYKIVFSILKRERFDLVHTHGYFADIIAIPLCRIFGIPVISTCHGFIAATRALRLYNRLDLMILRLADRVIAVSDDMRAQLVRNKVPSRKIEVIVNAVPVVSDATMRAAWRQELRSRLQLREADLVVGFVGRLSPEKGAHVFVTAMTRLMREGVSFKVIVVGDGPERANLESAISDAGLSGQFVFAGFQKDVEQWWAAVDIFVLSSLTEGTPLALLEAISLNIPVVATPVGGVGDIVENGVNGLLAAPGDPDELAAATRRLIDSPELRTRLAAEATRQFRLKYDFQQWCRRIEAQYTDVAAGVPGKTSHA